MYQLPIHKNTILFLSHLIVKAQSSMHTLNSVLKKHYLISQDLVSMEELEKIVYSLSEEQLNLLITDDQFVILKLSLDQYFEKKMQESPIYVETFLQSIKEGEKQKWQDHLKEIENEEQELLTQIREKIN